MSSLTASEQVPEGALARRQFISLCADALASSAGGPTRDGVLAQKQLDVEIAGRRLGYYANAQWAVAALKASGLADSEIRAAGVARRDVVDALVVPWFDKAGDIGGVVFRRNTALTAPNPYGETIIRYALAGDRDALPLDGAIEARRAGHDWLTVVEGTTDFLALRQARVSDVATPHTCAIRPGQLIHARSLGFRGLTLCFDPDFAGWRGMLSAIEGAFACGLDVRLARPGEAGEDIDEMLQRAGVPGFRALLAETSDGLTAYARAIIVAAAETPDPKLAIADIAARFSLLAGDDTARARLEPRFWPIIDAEAGQGVRLEAVARAAEAAQGRRLQISPIGSLLKNRSGSARLWTGS